MLTQQQISNVKSTVPVLESAGTVVTEHFYDRMFKHNPEVKHIFNMSNQHSGKQQFALFSTIVSYAKYLDTPEVLAEMVERIANKHTSMNILPEQYEIVGHHFLESLRELIPEYYTAEVEEAWALAYEQLANIFIQRESKIYQSNKEQVGGWSGAREFVLVEKRIESELVKSLVFQPADGGEVAGYKPGQYLGIEVQPEGHEYREIRQYSLSAAPRTDTYQISVKREIVGRPGIVSNYLHDGLRLGESVTLYAPVGDFYVELGDSPLVLISAGVGITPMQAILESVVANNPQRAVYFLHACEHPAQHSFKRQHQNMKKDANLHLYTWYKNEAESAEGTFHGFMDISLIDDLPLQDGDFYLCGPAAFMGFAKQQLLTMKVDDERIHYEVFGPHEDL